MKAKGGGAMDGALFVSNMGAAGLQADLTFIF